MGTHFSFLFSIYSENHGVQAEQLNFSRSSDITYVSDSIIHEMKSRSRREAKVGHGKGLDKTLLPYTPFEGSQQGYKALQHINEKSFQCRNIQKCTLCFSMADFLLFLCRGQFSDKATN